MRPATPWRVVFVLAVTIVVVMIAARMFGNEIECSWADGCRGVPQSRIEVILPAVIAGALEDYRPVDALTVSPDDYDAAADWCWDQYMEVTAVMWQQAFRADSLESEFYAARVRIAELERQTSP